MTHTFYNRFIKPLSEDSDQAEREIVLNYLLVGIFGLAVITLAASFIGPLVSGEPVHPLRLLNMFLNTLFIIGLYFVARYRRHYTLVAAIITLLIALFGCAVAKQWGILDPYGVLLLGLAVVMASILIGARYALYVAIGLMVVLFYLQHGQANGSLHPDLSWMGTNPTPPEIGDAVVISTILFLIALVSWLFNRQMEMSLKRAQHSEKALQHQKDLLEVKVEKRARQLEAAQLEKMQQLYRFAELGQLSTALFHDLANHLSTVNVDIEGLAAGKRPDIMKRIQHNVGEINDIVRRVRQQIGGKNSVEVFDILHEVREVIKILAPTAEQSKVMVTMVIDKSLKPSLLYKGDITRFRQVILNLICNGMEAYPSPTRRSQPANRVVTIELSHRRSMLLVNVHDDGRGIRRADQTKVFEPFYTTKKKGVGIGLFIVQQVVKKDFGGDLTLTSDKKRGTTFSISLPKSYYAKKG